MRFQNQVSSRSRILMVGNDRLEAILRASRRAWASLILWSGLIGTESSSARYSNRNTCPPGRSAL